MKQLSILVLFLCVLTYACESSSDENTPNGYMDVNDDHYVIKGITITGINLDEESTTYTYDMRIHFDETIPGENWNKLLIDLYSPDSIVHWELIQLIMPLLILEEKTLNGKHQHTPHILQTEH